MADKTTKVLLLAIALGLWVHVVADFARPTPAHAQGILSDNYNMLQELKSISGDTSVMNLTLSSIRRDVASIQSTTSGIALRR